MNLKCRIFGHVAKKIITGFRNIDKQAIGRCARCDSPILLKYYAAPYLFELMKTNERCLAEKREPGPIKFIVRHIDDKVFIDFRDPVQSVLLTGNQSIEFGNALIKHGRKANKAGLRLIYPRGLK